MSYKLGFAAALLIGLVAFGGLGGIGLLGMASAQPAGVKINEVELNPRGRDAGGEWIEIYNPTGAEVNIGDYKIKTSYRSTTITIPADTVVGAGQLYVFAIDGEKLSNGDLLTLADGSDRVVDKTPALVDRSDSGLTWQRLPDGGSAWKLVEGTKAVANDSRTFKSASASSNSASTVQSSSSSSGNAGQCIGSAQCLEGKVVRVTDADTLTVMVGSDKYVVDLSLTKAGKGDRSFTQNLCFGTERVVVDQDDRQPGRGKNIMGVVYCGSTNLNQQLLDGGQASLDPRQCARSEFASQDWAKRHGC
jgi:hypothetical protein